MQSDIGSISNSVNLILLRSRLLGSFTLFPSRILCSPKFNRRHYEVIERFHVHVSLRNTSNSVFKRNYRQPQFERPSLRQNSNDFLCFDIKEKDDILTIHTRNMNSGSLCCCYDISFGAVFTLCKCILYEVRIRYLSGHLF